MNRVGPVILRGEPMKRILLLTLITLATLAALGTGASARFQEDCGPEVGPCPVVCTIQESSAIAHENGTVTLHVTANGAYDLYRSAGGGDPQLLGHFNGTQDHFDANTTVGVTYTYWLVVGPALCERVDVTAIPVFPTWAGALVAVGASTVAYLGLRWRAL